MPGVHGSLPLSDEVLRERAQQRLREKSNQMPNGCLEWTGFKNDKGYGITTYGWGRNVTAHRLAYALAHNLKIPFDGTICHKCDNRSCVNPEHLFRGTPADNNRDRDAKLRNARGERHGRRKLSADQVLQIRADPRSHQEIAEHYGVHKVYVSRLKTRGTWKCLD